MATAWLMAAIVCVVVANAYYVQPLLADIANTFGLTASRAGAVAMLSQVGTATGMFVFVPLGDALERRTLIVTLLVAASVILTLFATAQTVPWLLLASFAVGTSTATVHIVLPFAAHLAAPSQRGKVVGIVLSGLLLGILLARTFSGLVGAAFGWRAVYLCGAVAMLLLATVVRLRLPVSRPHVSLSWLALMRSAFGLIRRYPALRESAFLGAMFFCAFSAFWTTLIFFLESPAYGYGSAVAGLFGLIGAVGAAGAPTVGHLADKHGPRITILAALLVTLLSFVVLGLMGTSMAGLIVGVILMDLGVQVGHVASQTRIYGIDPAARSRLNMVYMVSYFLGGALGSYLGALCWRWGGWWAVCGFGGFAAVLGLGGYSYFGWKERLRAARI